MPDYDFSKLTWRSFEQLVQSIAIREIGPGLVIFGDGPDGAREASFDGTIPFPNKDDPWEGYLVVQAKFLQRLQGTRKDGEWVIKQCRAELEKFLDPRKNLRTPNYYLFATNVILTPAHNEGTKDKLNELIQNFAQKLHLKAFDVWDYDKICRFLDCHEDIRHSYMAWVTPGDVLAKVLEHFKPHIGEFDQVITNFLQKELLSDQYARLEQAGHSTDNRIPLASVFVDLPVADKLAFDPPVEDNEAQNLKKGFVSEIVEISRHRLAPSFTNMQKRTNSTENGVSAHIPGRFVLIGGPGQGKTTAGQFICQLFRTAILKNRPTLTISPEVTQALTLIESQCQSANITLPSVPRFPIRIELSDLAYKLSYHETSGINSLLGYIIDRIKRKTECDINPMIFREWLKAYPWIVILDGLDEVSSSSNRAEVLDAVRNFWVDSASLDADVLVVATTRPQGYNQEYSPDLYKHRWLMPLSTLRALHYGKSLAEVKYGNDRDRFERIVSRLRKAASHESIARLMRSPLQVTIMAPLVDRIGQPPEERWNLFNEYYNVIYQREVERDIPASIILREHKPDIDSIHSRVGLLLQLASDYSGGTDASLSASEFNRVVEERLKEEGNEGKRLHDLNQSIINAAMQRLVFLVGVREDRVGFEIRSLREFMAAEAFMDGNDEQVGKRLREIAPLMNWRNVILFAAGKCYTIRQHLRDTIQSICAELNENVDGDEKNRIVRAGSELALDLLEDGPSRRQPKYAQSLTRLAMRILDLPPNQNQIRLARLYNGLLERIYREEIEAGLQRMNLTDRLGAWHCLLELAETQVEWAIQMLESHWVKEEGKLQIAKFCPSKILNSKLAQIIPEWSSAITPIYTEHFSFGETYKGLFNIVSKDNETLITNPKWVNASLEFLVERRPKTFNEIPCRFIHGIEILRFRYSKIEESKKSPLTRLVDMPNPSDFWQTLISCARFCENPTKSTLALELKYIAELSPTLQKGIPFDWLPWPLAACLNWSLERNQLLMLADKAENGELGDYEDWIGAEKRLIQTGIIYSDLEYIIGTDLPFDKNISSIGFPQSLNWVISRAANLKKLIPYFIEMNKRYRKTKLGSTFGCLAIVTFEDFGDIELEMTSDDFKVWIEDTVREYCNLESLLTLWTQESLGTQRIEIFDLAGKTANFIQYWGSRLNRRTWRTESDEPKLIQVVRDLSKEYTKNPSLTGIMRILAYANMAGYEISVPKMNIDNIDYQMYEDLSISGAAICLKISQNRGSVEEATRIANFVIQNENVLPNLVWDLMGIIHFNNLKSEFIDKLLLDLYNGFQSKDWEKISKCLWLIRNRLEGRASGLVEQVTWSDLGLPNSLFNLIQVKI